MSDDLISRDALLKDFRNMITEQSDTMDWLNIIARQPTAYDMDKVVEKFEEEIEKYRKVGSMSMFEWIAALEIVKGDEANE